MDATAICRCLCSAGVCLSTDGDKLLAAPASALNDDLRTLIRENKPALMRLLRDAHITTANLIAAAMRACDVHGDGEDAREQMRRDCLATPSHLRADLLAYFDEAYPPAESGLDGRTSAELPAPDTQVPASPKSASAADR
jgi:hypothetical protein